MEHDDQKLMLTPTAVDMQDVKQEATLLELETGKTISIRVIWAKLSSTDRVLYYGDYHRCLDIASDPWRGCESVNPMVISMLIDWALTQPTSTQEVVFSFLDSEDKETALPLVLEKLGLSEITQKSRKSGSKMSMAEIMRRSLPLSKDDLISLIQRVSPETKRPASRVRQFIRDETRAGRIYLGEDDKYHHDL